MKFHSKFVLTAIKLSSLLPPLTKGDPGDFLGSQAFQIPPLFSKGGILNLIAVKFVLDSIVFHLGLLHETA
jgi:hypothetical protein